MALPTVAAPGQSLVSALTYTAGPGTYVFKEQIRAAAVGAVTLSADGKSVSVTNPVLPTDGSGTVLPDVGSTVLARVTRINPRQATVSIFCVGDLVTGDEFQGIIRAQDVRATEKDKVRIYTSFRPGDVVRAQVISLGDQSNYYLTTASNSLGVVMATSEDGEEMHPLNWRQMAGARTGVVEERKVAKPI